MSLVFSGTYITEIPQSMQALYEINLVCVFDKTIKETPFIVIRIVNQTEKKMGKEKM